MLRRVWGNRKLLTSLVRRHFQVRYRQSVAGFVWAVVPPLATLGAAALLFGEVVGVETGGTPYAVFAMAGLVPWTFLASSLSSGVASVTNSLTAVSRIAFPRAVLPLSIVGVSLFDLLISTAIFVVLAYATGVGLPMTALWIPIVLAVELAFVSGVVLLLSAVNVFARDVRLAVPILVQVWLLLTPVMYPLSEVPGALRSWYLLNPMTGIVEWFRGVALPPGGLPGSDLLAPAIIGSVAVSVLGVWYFGATESRFADVI